MSKCIIFGINVIIFDKYLFFGITPVLLVIIVDLVFMKTVIPFPQTDFEFTKPIQSSLTET